MAKIYLASAVTLHDLSELSIYSFLNTKLITDLLLPYSVGYMQYDFLGKDSKLQSKNKVLQLLPQEADLVTISSYSTITAQTLFSPVRSWHRR